MTHEDSLSKPETPQPAAFDGFSPLPPISFRSKHGAPLDTNVVPSKPVATVSALIPTPRPARAAQASVTGFGQPVSPSAAFMTTLPGQEHLGRSEASDATAVSADKPLAKAGQMPIDEHDAFALGKLNASGVSPQVFTDTSKRGMVVAGLVVCGMLMGLAGIWWADQPHSHQARADQVASSPSGNPFPARNTSAFAATGYNPGTTGYSGGAGAERSELVIPPLPSLEKQTRQPASLAKEDGGKPLPAALTANPEEEKDRTPAFSQAPAPPAKVAVAPSKPRLAKTTNRTQRNLQALRSCSRGANLFEREKCKWKVCGNSWGKYGCPSYD